ncbi:MAG: ACP S-malonyltransferase, partial [Candidatus Omnitrophica bacterium]|nr:ACP S-malonyltransferase [Candidatus Omnitrophota bacterium]
MGCLCDRVVEAMQRIVFLFPGQGSQYVGMGRDLVENFSESKKVFEEAERILGLPLQKYCFDGPSEMLKSTSICQIAVFTVSMAAFYALRERFDLRPVYTLGLSLGEYSALVAAGVLEFQTGLKLVRYRGELMGEVAKKVSGKMCAVIGLDRESVRRICAECGDVYIANFNSPEQIVISGEKDSIDKAKQLCLQQGALKVIELEVDGPFHSPFMQNVAEGPFKEYLEGIIFSSAQMPV